jgi:hypothetical protein
LRELRPGKVDLRRGCLLPRFRIVQHLPGHELTLGQILRPLEIGVGEAQVRFALPHRRLGDLQRGFELLDLLGDLAVLDARKLLTTRDAVTQLHRHRLQATIDLWSGIDGCLTDQVSDDGDLL